METKGYFESKVARREASIRPRHIGRGNSQQPSRPPAQQQQASIRPRHIGRGNLAVDAGGEGRHQALQFGHGTSAVETEQATGRTASCRSFNSATAHRPWKHRALLRPLAAHGRLQFGHGTSAVETRVWGKISPQRGTLQFGHGTSAVETHRGKAEAQDSILASIRPRHIGRGNRPATSHRLNQTVSFNSATAHRPWKRADVAFPDVAMNSLQFGHGTSAVETSMRRDGRAGVGPRFNSATAHRPWKHGCCHDLPPCGCCFNSATAHRPWKRWPASSMANARRGFNSATAHRPWKLVIQITVNVVFVGLQFGHGTSAVET